MLNMLWALMILVGIVYGALNGTMKEITEAMLESAGEAVSLCIATGGVMAFWTGMMEVAESAGLIRSLTKKMDPFIRFLFPGQEVYFPEYHCQYTGTWLGLHTGGIESHGSTGSHGKAEIRTGL